MAEDTGSGPLRVIGRILTVAGYAWLGLFFFGGRILSQFGLDIGALGGFGGIIPAFLLLGAGRTLRKRGAPAEESPAEQQPRPTATERAKQRPVSPPAPKPAPSPRPRSDPVKEERAVTRSLEEALAEMGHEPTHPEAEIEAPSGPAEHSSKTSAEMLEEARKRWGSKPAGG